MLVLFTADAPPHGNGHHTTDGARAGPRRHDFCYIAIIRRAPTLHAGATNCRTALIVGLAGMAVVILQSPEERLLRMQARPPTGRCWTWTAGCPGRTRSPCGTRTWRRCWRPAALSTRASAFTSSPRRRRSAAQVRQRPMPCPLAGQSDERCPADRVHLLAPHCPPSAQLQGPNESAQPLLGGPWVRFAALCPSQGAARGETSAGAPSGPWGDGLPPCIGSGGASNALHGRAQACVPPAHSLSGGLTRHHVVNVRQCALP